MRRRFFPKPTAPALKCSAFHHSASPSPCPRCYSASEYRCSPHAKRFSLQPLPTASAAFTAASFAVFAVNGLLHVAAHGVGRHLVPFFFAVQKRKQRQDNDHQKQNCNKNQRQMFRFLFRNRFKRKTRRAFTFAFIKTKFLPFEFRNNFSTDWF